MTAGSRGARRDGFSIAALATLPIAVWEFSLGVYLTVWGFRASPVTAGMFATDNRE